MTAPVDIVEIPLWPILRDVKLLRKLHEIQTLRVEERDITGGDRPDGMRLSIADPVRRVKAVFEPFWAVSFDQGVGERGYLAEDLLEVALFHWDYAPMSGRQYATQVTIHWHKHGTSAFDFVVPAYEGGERVVSCKSSVNDRKPSRENIAQERRMMTYAGYPAGSVFEVWMVDPGGLVARGPFVYGLGQDDIDDARLELSRLSKAYAHFAALPTDPTDHLYWNDEEAWLENFGLRSSTSPFRVETLDASPAIEGRVRAWERSRRKRKAAEFTAETDNELLWTHIDEQLELQRKAGVARPKIVAHAGDEIVTFSRKSNGHRQVTVRPATKQVAA